MRQIYINSLVLVMRRIKTCSKGIKTNLDQYSLNYWCKELDAANVIKSYIEKRLKMGDNVIYIDFKSKKRVA